MQKLKIQKAKYAKKKKKEAYLVQLFEDQIEKNKKKWVFLPVGNYCKQVNEQKATLQIAEEFKC